MSYRVVRLSVVRPSDVNFSHLLQNCLMDFVGMKYSHGPLKVLFFGQIPQGRVQGGAKISHGGTLLQETSSSDRKATATNGMHNNDLEACGMKCCYFWFHSEAKILTRFLYFDLSHFDLFKCSFYRFLCSKVINLHLFCVISRFDSRRIII